MSDIKSVYNIKNFLLFLRKEKKFELIKYNNKYQKKLEIDIEDYKMFRGRYRENEKDGFVKEYELDTNILLFEGHFNKGKRNGEGKEYYNNKQIKFKGEYLNGREWLGEKYDNKGKIFLKYEKRKMEEKYIIMENYY